MATSTPTHRRQLGQSAANLALGAAQQNRPVYGVSGGGGGNSLNNYNVNGQAGLGYPLINGGDRRPSVGIGATIGGGSGAVGGQHYGSGPNYGVGVGVRIPFRKR